MTDQAKARVYFAEMRARMDEQRRRAETLAVAFPAHGLTLVSKNSPERGLFISPDLDTPGHWRATYFDRHGFGGHYCESTLPGLLADALNSYQDSDRELLRRLALAPDWYKSIPL